MTFKLLITLSFSLTMTMQSVAQLSGTKLSGTLGSSGSSGTTSKTESKTSTKATGETESTSGSTGVMGISGKTGTSSDKDGLFGSSGKTGVMGSSGRSDGSTSRYSKGNLSSIFTIGDLYGSSYESLYELTSEVIFNHDELSTNDDQTFFMVYDTDADNCLTKTLNSAYLMAIFNTGEIHNYNYGTDKEAEVNFKVYGYEEGSTSGTELCDGEITLEISESSPEQVFRYNLTDDYTDYSYFIVEIGSYTIDTDWDASESIQLKVYVDIDYGIYVYGKDLVDINEPVSGNRTLSGSNRTLFSWESEAICEEIPNYQIQILKLYNICENYYGYDRSVYTVIDWSKALTIETEGPQTELKLTLAEGTGYYTWRVRPIGNYYDGGVAHYKNWGEWSESFEDGYEIEITEDAGIPSENSEYLFYYDQFDETKNWIYSRTFTEGNPDGSSGVKIAEGIQYADGLSRTRQSQRYLQEEEDVLMNQTVYDYVGRSAIQTMTAPVDQGELSYKELLITPESDKTRIVQAVDFDTDYRIKKYVYTYPTSTDYHWAPLWENSQAVNGEISDYYSDDNEDLTVPNAENFPYTRTLYHHDGRVKKQSLFGAEHRMGLYDQTYVCGGYQRLRRTYYSAVADTELIKVFGNETPEATRVTKVIRVDENDLGTVEYIMDGKTIATCMIDPGEHYLLDDVDDGIVPDMILKEIKGKRPLTEWSNIKEQILVFSDPGVEVKLTGLVDVKNFSASCVDYCSTCDYQIYVYIYREETEEIIWDITHQINPDDYLCIEDQWELPANENANGEETGCVLSDPGAYRIGRVITVDNVVDDENPSYTYADLHTDEVGELMDEEISKFDDLIDILEGNSGTRGALSRMSCPGGNENLLCQLYDYIEDLPSSDAPSMEFSTSSSYKGMKGYFSSAMSGSSSGGGIGSRTGTGSFSGSSAATKGGVLGTGIATSSSSTDSEIWLVDINYDDAGDIESYEVASECCMIEIPKIPCNWNPCEDLWISYADDGEEYDYSIEEKLIDKFEGYYDFEAMLLEKYSATYGNNLYKYFYDKKGQYLFPINYKDEISFYIDDTENPEDCIVLTSLYDVIFNITIEDESGELYYKEITFADRTYTNDFVEEIYNTIVSDLNSIGYDLQIEEKSTGAKELSISYEFSNYPLDNNVSLIAHKIMMSVEGYCMKNDYSTTPQIRYSKGGYGKFWRTDNNCSLSYCDNYGNGLINTLLTKMVKEDGIDCYDMYMAWEIFVENWEQNYQAIYESIEMGGYASHPDFLIDLFLKPNNLLQYQGFTDNLYSWDDGSILNAHKYFQVPEDNNDQVENCEDMYNVDFSADISTWGNPDDWNVDLCGSSAWWDGSVIADDPDESDTCKAWLQLYGCITTNPTLDKMNFGLNSLSADATESQVQELADSLVSKAKFVMRNRIIGIQNNILKNNTAILPGYAKYGAVAITDEISADITLTVSTDDDGNFVLGSDDEKALMYKVFNYRTNASDAIADISNPIVTGASYTARKSEIVLKELNEFATKRGMSEMGMSELSEYLSKIKKDFGWNINATTLSMGVIKTGGKLKAKSGTAFSFTAASGKITAKFTSFSGTIISSPILDLSSFDTDVTIGDFALEFTDKIEFGQPRYSIPNRVVCDQRNIDYVKEKIEDELQECKQQRIDWSLQNYKTSCALPSSMVDTFKISYYVKYHQYTLLYYDAAGNLVEVVPPHGVDIKAENPTRNDEKEHTFKTEYTYNSMGQRMTEVTPDGGKKYFWYNDIGQLRFSQNEKQQEQGVYSYLKYDALGRIIEAGESDEDVETISPLIMAGSVKELSSASKSFTASKSGSTAYSFGGKTASSGGSYTFGSVKFTLGGALLTLSDEDFYDKVDDGDYPETGFHKAFTVYSNSHRKGKYIDDTEQQYLENRVSYTYTDEDGEAATKDDQVYTYFSYDPHGNVEYVVQQIPGFGTKYIAYEYDLYTGKVRKVKFNEGETDQFYHRYSYDSDNRIQKVETSRDDVIWDVDAEYQYHAYGPLKRVSVGEDHIQGLDYVYTINNWLKAMNHPTRNSDNDPGGDGASGSSYGDDLFGMTLGYFDGDFKRKYTGGSTTTHSPFNSAFRNASSSEYEAGEGQLSWTAHVDNENTINNKPLFNGSITNWSYSTADNSTLSKDEASVNHIMKGYKYHYNELYFITQANFDYYDGTGWQMNIEGASASEDAAASRSLYSYATNYSYDLGGNIQSLQRYGSNNDLMDALSYNYYEGTNKLEYVDDTIASSVYTDDMEDQISGNYKYDELGQLIADSASGVKEIYWTVTGKVDSVLIENKDADGHLDRKLIDYTYDAFNNKVMKVVTTIDNYSESDESSTTVTTYYVRDAKGNIMGIYKTDADNVTTFEEAPVYASGKIGVVKPSIRVTKGSTSSGTTTSKTSSGTSKMGSFSGGFGSGTVSTTTQTTFTRKLGAKYYELNDHLGNVRAVSSDEKFNDGDGTYSANMVSAQDYYPFGMMQPGKNWSSDDYRYGFQGKEKENDLMGQGLAYDFGARIYDPRLGRWMSMDPLAYKFPGMSPYVAMDNNAINKVDMDGMEAENVEQAQSLANTQLLPAFKELVGEQTARALLDMSEGRSIEFSSSMEIGISAAGSGAKKKSGYKVSMTWDSRNGMFVGEQGSFSKNEGALGIKNGVVTSQLFSDDSGGFGWKGSVKGGGFGATFKVNSTAGSTTYGMSLILSQTIIKAPGVTVVNKIAFKIDDFETVMDFLIQQGYIDKDGYVRDDAYQDQEFNRLVDEHLLGQWKALNATLREASKWKSTYKSEDEDYEKDALTPLRDGVPDNSLNE